MVMKALITNLCSLALWIWNFSLVVAFIPSCLWKNLDSKTGVLHVIFSTSDSWNYEFM